MCATDAGREGELIFRYIYAAAGCRKPVRRLWISSLTPEAIRRGFAALRPLSDFDPLADAAHGRARADWLVGMNLSRAATLAHGELFSVGRVQTPTLALLVEREKAIRAFVPEDYLEVVATFAPGEDLATTPGQYRGTWFRGDQRDTRGPAAADGRGRGEAHRRARARRTGGGGVGRVGDAPAAPAPALRPHRAAATRESRSTASRRRRRSPPRSRSTRTGSSSPTRAPTAGTSRATWPPPARGGGGRSPGPTRSLLAPGTGERPLGRRFVDDAKVTDHHAILPTAVSRRRRRSRPATSAASTTSSAGGC